jgi:hypothetical protein
MPMIGPYHVTSNNASYGKKPQRASARVKLNGVILSEVYHDHSNPLRWMQRRPQDATRKDFVAQMQLNGISEDDIKAIMAYVPNVGQGKQNN